MKNKLRGLFLATAALVSFNAHSATITVDSNADTGTTGCTLRNAIKSSNSNTNNGGCTAGDAGVDTIQFNADMTITLTNGSINITDKVIIDGQTNAIIVDADNSSRIFVIPSAGDDTSINALTLQNGSGTEGGAIYSMSALSISNSTVRNNTASVTHAGAIHAGDTVDISSSTFSGNRATTYGGAVSAENATIINSTFSGNRANNQGGAINASYATISNSTFSGNSALNHGGAIFADNTATINSSILLNNTAPNGKNCGGTSGTISGTINGTNNLFETGAECGTGTETTLAEVLVTDNSGNALLADNDCTPAQATPAGCTHTIALLASTSNPAIDAGSAGGLTTDQRGFALNGQIDIGAFEIQPPQYSLSYDVNGGSTITPNPVSYLAGESVTLATTSKTGYTFAGWNDGSTNVTSPYAMPTSNTKLTAKWTATGTNPPPTTNTTSSIPSLSSLALLALISILGGFTFVGSRLRRSMKS